MEVIEPGDEIGSGARGAQKIKRRCRFLLGWTSHHGRAKETESLTGRRTPMKMHQCIAVATLFFAATAAAGSPRHNKPAGKVDAAAAFSRLKGLAGDWDVESARGKAHSRFEVIAGGAVVLEHFTEPNGGEMLTAYHLD